MSILKLSNTRVLASIVAMAVPKMGAKNEKAAEKSARKVTKNLFDNIADISLKVEAFDRANIDRNNTDLQDSSEIIEEAKTSGFLDDLDSVLAGGMDIEDLMKDSKFSVAMLELGNAIQHLDDNNVGYTKRGLAKGQLKIISSDKVSDDRKMQAKSNASTFFKAESAEELQSFLKKKTEDSESRAKFQALLDMVEAGAMTREEARDRLSEETRATGVTLEEMLKTLDETRDLNADMADELRDQTKSTLKSRLSMLASAPGSVAGKAKSSGMAALGMMENIAKIGAVGLLLWKSGIGKKLLEFGQTLLGSIQRIFTDTVGPWIKDKLLAGYDKTKGIAQKGFEVAGDVMGDLSHTFSNFIFDLKEGLTRWIKEKFPLISGKDHSTVDTAREMARKGNQVTKALDTGGNVVYVRPDGSIMTSKGDADLFRHKNGMDDSKMLDSLVKVNMIKGGKHSKLEMASVSEITKTKKELTKKINLDSELSDDAWKKKHAPEQWRAEQAHKASQASSNATSQSQPLPTKGSGVSSRSSVSMEAGLATTANHIM